MFNGPNYNMIDKYANARINKNNCGINNFDENLETEMTFNENGYRDNNNRLNHTINEIIYNTDNYLHDNTFSNPPPKIDNRSYSVLSNVNQDDFRTKSNYDQRNSLEDYKINTLVKNDKIEPEQQCEKKDDKVEKKIEKELKLIKLRNKQFITFGVIITIVIIIIVFSIAIFQLNKKINNYQSLIPKINHEQYILGYV